MLRAAVAVAMGLGACSPVPLGDGERLTVVKSLADQVILPALADSTREAAALEQALRDFEGDPSAARLETARAAWARARVPWKATAPVLFGPGRDVAGAVDWFPVDRKKVDELLASSDPVDAAGVAALGASRRGFHAIELLLFDDEGYVAAAALAGPEGGRRRTYLTSLAGDIDKRLSELQAAWTGGHLQAFTAPGHGGSAYATIDASVDSVVNESIGAAERATALLARPLGLMTGGDPRPELAESLPSDGTAAELAATVRGIRDLYVGSRSGADGRGIAALVKSRNLDLRLRAALDTAVARLEAVPHPFRAALLARDPSVSAAYEAVRELRRLCATELVANLGATLKFSDNDGD